MFERVKLSEGEEEERETAPPALRETQLIKEQEERVMDEEEEEEEEEERRRGDEEEEQFSTVRESNVREDAVRVREIRPPPEVSCVMLEQETREREENAQVTLSSEP